MSDSNIFKDSDNTFWVQGSFGGMTISKIKRLVESNGGLIAKDYTDVDLKRCILSGAVWGAEGTAGGSLVVKQIKKANQVNLIEPEEGDVVDDPHENRVWILPIDWLTDSIEAGEMLPEEDYDFEFGDEKSREKKKKAAYLDRKANGGKSRYAPGQRQRIMAEREQKAALKQFELEEAERLRTGKPALSLDAPTFAGPSQPFRAPPPAAPKPALTAPVTDPKPGLIAKPVLTQSSLSFAPPRPEETDPWDVYERRKNRGGAKKSEPSSKLSRAPPSKPAPAPAPAKKISALKDALQDLVERKSSIKKDPPCQPADHAVLAKLNSKPSLLGDKSSGMKRASLPKAPKVLVKRSSITERNQNWIELPNSSDTLVISDSEDDLPSRKKARV